MTKFRAVEFTPFAYLLGETECTDPASPRFLNTIPVELVRIHRKITEGETAEDTVWPDEAADNRTPAPGGRL